ncbi:MAG: hypothetical protein Q7K43_04575 [Candidatus Woesearchaeota archaeon]|nr:hypothetical protein [Candidatus Woesearchaeota archaeon]
MKKYFCFVCDNEIDLIKSQWIYLEAIGRQQTTYHPDARARMIRVHRDCFLLEAGEEWDKAMWSKENDY